MSSSLQPALTDWSLDQAMAFIISGGAISPDTVSYERLPDITPPPEPGPK